MAEDAPFFPGLSPVSGKPVHVAFDGGRLTSDAGVLLLAEIERKLGIAERLACCIAAVTEAATCPDRAYPVHRQRRHRRPKTRTERHPHARAIADAELPS